MTATATFGDTGKPDHILVLSKVAFVVRYKDGIEIYLVGSEKIFIAFENPTDIDTAMADLARALEQFKD